MGKYPDMRNAVRGRMQTFSVARHCDLPLRAVLATLLHVSADTVLYTSMAAYVVRTSLELI